MRYNLRRCRECRSPFKPKRFEIRTFAGVPAAALGHSWREAKGATAVELLLRWRRKRQRGSFAELTAFADDLIHDLRDRERSRLDGIESSLRPPGAEVRPASLPPYGRASEAALPDASPTP